MTNKNSSILYKNARQRQTLTPTHYVWQTTENWVSVPRYGPVKSRASETLQISSIFFRFSDFRIPLIMKFVSNELYLAQE